ncbi:hypothetical protein PENTCL1PPCAC_19301 [Pristionchus entomophagus]|uniref:G protein-coupled receptor n=1 Tax=Pristionchus entomophagus TaxID=358040 RepID=A0AAV5TRW7_9BILA|nr:hypothetical protein PENTCL1PPCAC_19300 [Pristionchus entomophagus]GMS97126.1 hypothetical protein PENTCL1PPCAC_19301 [Pristionchus entomophagus]
MGLFCPYIPYQVLMIIVVFLNMSMFSAFGMMLVARHQLLIMEDSVFKMRPVTKYASFILINVAMHSMTVISILVLRSSCEGQIGILNAYPQLKWRERDLNWFIFYGPDFRAVMNYSYYGFFSFIPIVAIFILLPCAHMLFIVLRYVI